MKAVEYKNFDTLELDIIKTEKAIRYYKRMYCLRPFLLIAEHFRLCGMGMCYYFETTFLTGMPSTMHEYYKNSMYVTPKTEGLNYYWFKQRDIKSRLKFLKEYLVALKSIKWEETK